MKIVARIMDCVEKNMEMKIKRLEKLVRKNKRNLAKATKDHDKVSSIITTYFNRTQTKSISDDIRLYFALAKGDKLHLAG